MGSEAIEKAGGAGKGVGKGWGRWVATCAVVCASGATVLLLARQLLPWLIVSLLVTPPITYTEIDESLQAEFVMDGLYPTLEELGGMRVAWQAPIGAPRAVAVLLHGCQHGGVDWFLLPEDKALTSAVLERGIAVIAATSSDRRSGCWQHQWPSGWRGGYLMPVDVETIHFDLFHLGMALEMLLEREGWKGLPIYAMGASSGAVMASMLPHQLQQFAHVEGVALYIHSGAGEAFNTLRHLREPPKKWAFIHMTRDARTAAKVGATMAALNEAHTAAKEWPIPPLALTPTTFYERMMGSGGVERVSPGDSRQMFKLLQSYSILGSDGMLLEDPRQTHWEAALRRDTNVDAVLASYLEHVREVLNEHWAMHEMTGRAAGDIVDWLTSP